MTQKVKLSEVCRIVGGSTPDTTNNSFWNGDIVWITPADLGKLDKTEIATSERKITKSGYENCSTELIPVGSVVLSTRAPIGHLGIATVPLCTNQGCKSIIPGPRVDSAFLYFQLLKSVAELQKLGSGATFTELPKSKLENFEIFLPSLEEQRDIASRLTQQFTTIDKAQAAAEERLKATNALVAAYLREEFASPVLRQHPMKTLGELCNIRLGKMLSPVSMTGTRSRPYLRNANVQWGRFDLSDVAEMDFTEAEEAKLALKPGDLLVCEGGEPGRAAIWRGEIEPCCYQKALHRLRPLDRGIDPRYIMYRLWLGGVTAEFVDTHAKTTIAHLPEIRLRKLYIQVPPIDVQLEVVQRLETRMEATEVLVRDTKSHLNEIANLPGVLLREVFEVGNDKDGQ